ncbi:MAG TPA: TIGR00730 family Rossman fold protein, partial [Candidatus Binatia bacterium]|nr:TIGR00730 family Rossman fold protein [Candidatus Binatia bacterium]
MAEPGRRRANTGAGGPRRRPRRARPRAPEAGPTQDELLLDRATAVADDPWRVLRIMGEFVEGFETLAGLGPAVAVFGSARVPPGSRQYQ